MAFLIWTLVACIFPVIAWKAWHAKTPVAFFTVGEAPRVKDVTGYNRAVARIWLVFAAVLELIGVPLLFVGQNSPLALLVMLAVPVLVIGCMAAYSGVLNRFSE